MVSLNLGNSYSKISGLTDTQLKELRKILSYQISTPGSFQSNMYGPRTAYLITKKGEFPTGLLSKVQNYLFSNKIEIGSFNTSRKVPTALPDAFDMKLPYTPYPDQGRALLACLVKSRGTVSACTGFGKSILMAMLVNDLRVKTLIIVPNLELKRQLTDSFTQYFGDKMTHITIENIDSKALKTAKGYDCLIIDEAHHVAAKTYRELNKKVWSGIYYRYFFTATPFRSKDEEQLLFESIAGDVIYRIDYTKAVDMGYIVPIEAYYVDLPKIEITGNTWYQVYKQAVVDNKRRNLITSSILEQLARNDSSTLCLVKEVKHGQNLEDLSGAFFTYGGRESGPWLIKLFNENKLKVLIGTTGILGEGVDTRPCEYVVVAGLGRSKNQFMQQIGRAVRNYPGKQSAKIIIFRDASHKFTLRHFKEQVKILKDEYGVQAVKLELDLSKAIE